MRTTVAAGACLAATLGAAALAATGPGAPTGLWSLVGRPTADPGAVGLARTPDGVLHVVSRGGPGTELTEARVGADGRVLGIRRIPGSWGSLSAPALVATPDGALRLVVGAEGGASGSGQGIVTALVAPGTAAWTFATAPLAAGAGLGTSQVGAAPLRDGTPVVAWAAGGALRYRFASSGTTTVTVPDCCARAPAVGVDAVTGRVELAWVSAAPGSGGVAARSVDAAGTAARRLYAPGSAGLGRKAFAGDDAGRVAVSGRIGAPGVYVAYGHVAAVASPRRFVGVRLWRVGAAQPTLDLPAPGISDVALAPAPAGRFWLAWQRGGRVFATRTNRAATRVGPVRELSRPPRSRGVAQVQADGSTGPLDLVVDVSGRAGFVAWHARVLPGLLLKATAARAGGGLVRYSFRVTDAGDPVANATVRVGKQTLLTGASGTVVLETSDRPPEATATKAGFAAAAAALSAPAG